MHHADSWLQTVNVATPAHSERESWTVSANGDHQPSGGAVASEPERETLAHRLIHVVNGWTAGGGLGSSAGGSPDERTLAYTRYKRPAEEGASFDQMFSALYEGLGGWARGVEAAQARFYYPLLQDAFERTHGKILHR